MVGDAIAAGCEAMTIFATEDDETAAALADRSETELVRVSPEVLQKLAGTESPRGPVAIVRIPESAPVIEGSAIVLWSVSDPGNVGTLIRSAAAFGFGVIVTGTAADVWSPKVLRSAAGAHFATQIELADDLTVAALQARGFTTVALAATGRRPAALDRPIAILVGSEAHGLSREVMSAADLIMGIPMRGPVESLNAAVAGSIAMFAATNAEGRAAAGD